LFGSWTTLPAGPAALAAKTGAAIVHIAIRRSDDRQRFIVTYSDPIVVASTEPEEIQRATQAIADALGATIAAAPEQWYSFKPLWPAAQAEEAALVQRAAPGAPRRPRRRAPGRGRAGGRGRARHAGPRSTGPRRVMTAAPRGRTLGRSLRARA